MKSLYPYILSLGLMGTPLVAEEPTIKTEQVKETLEQLISKQPALTKAIIDVEGSNPDDVSYANAVGIMQITPDTAETLKRKHPTLPDLGEDIEETLKDPKINITYGNQFLEDAKAIYNNDRLVAASFNCGLYGPKLAADQVNLNRLSTIVKELELTRLKPDSIHGPKTTRAIRAFEVYWNRTHKKQLEIDGRMDSETRKTLHSAMAEHGIPMVKAVIPTISEDYSKRVINLKECYEK